MFSHIKFENLNQSCKNRAKPHDYDSIKKNRLIIEQNVKKSIKILKLKLRQKKRHRYVNFFGI